LPEAAAIAFARKAYRKLSRRPDAALNEIPMRLLGLFTGRTVRTSVRGQPFFVDMRDVSVSATILLQRKFEVRESFVASMLLKTGDYAIDIGANIGWYTALFAEMVGAAGHVLAVEPEPANAALLRENVRIRHIEQMVTIAEAALGDQECMVKLGLASDQKGDHRVVTHLANSRRETIDVPMVRLDDLASAWPRVDFLKMDIQGSEAGALHGMRSLLDRSPDAVLMVEFWPYGLRACGSEPIDLLNDLDALGFKIWRITSEGLILDEVIPSDFAGFVDRVGHDEIIQAPNILCARSAQRLTAVTLKAPPTG
jgi:FkbM family methyltransferase